MKSNYIAKMYYLNYIQTILLKPFGGIDISQIVLNLSEETSKSIKVGYTNLLLPGNHIDLNIDLKSPMIILPIPF